MRSIKRGSRVQLGSGEPPADGWAVSCREEDATMGDATRGTTRGSMMSRVDGHILEGVLVRKGMFQGVSSLDQLEAFGLSRPSAVERATVAMQKSNPNLYMAKSIRFEVQRRFDAARKKRAEAYAQYIEAVECDARLGGTPPITLYLDRRNGADVQVLEGQGLVIPYRSTLIAIDGETQTEARFILREKRADTGRLPIAVTVWYGITEQHAQQILHDYNTECHTVAERQVSPLNHEGQLSAAVNAAISGWLSAEQFNRHGSKPKKNQVDSYAQLVSPVLC